MEKEYSGHYWPTLLSGFSALSAYALWRIKNRNTSELTRTSIFDRFQIKTENIEDYEILGLDIGNGKWAAAKVDLDADQLKRIRPLFTQKDCESYIDASVLYRNMLSKSWEIGDYAADCAEKDGYSGDFFADFKMPAGSFYWKECYGNNLNNPTRETLMQELLKNILARLSDVNGSPGQSTNNNRFKKSILLVGLPVSDMDNAYLYRDMLAFLPEGKPADELQIAVASEAQAWYASEVRKAGRSFDPSKIRVFIDVGASATSAVVIQNQKIMGKLRRKIGASIIESNLLELALYDDCGPEQIDHLSPVFSGDKEFMRILNTRKELRKELQNVPYQKVEAPPLFMFSEFRKYCAGLSMPPEALRTRLQCLKEQFFGPTGNNGEQNLTLSFQFTSEPVQMSINAAIMRKALYQMPVFVPQAADSPALLYRSYFDAMSHFLDDLWKKCPHGNVTFEVFLTGGASVMPLVSTLVKQKLGVEPSIFSEPDSKTAQGLAYIGYTEFKKREKLAASEEVLGKIMTLWQSSLANRISEAVGDRQASIILDMLSDWANGEDGVSLATVRESKTSSCDTSPQLEPVITKWWKQHIAERFDKDLQSVFLHSDFLYFYRPALHIDIHSIVKIDFPQFDALLDFDAALLLGILNASAFGLNNTSYDTNQRIKFLQMVQNRKKKISARLAKMEKVILFGQTASKSITEQLKKEGSQYIANYMELHTPYNLQL